MYTGGERKRQYRNIADDNNENVIRQCQVTLQTKIINKTMSRKNIADNSNQPKWLTLRAHRSAGRSNRSETAVPQTRVFMHESISLYYYAPTPSTTTMRQITGVRASLASVQECGQGNQGRNMPSNRQWFIWDDSQQYQSKATVVYIGNHNGPTM